MLFVCVSLCLRAKGHSLTLLSSIISVMDGSLPKKPCKTCKNKFHAGCLYKVSQNLASASTY